MQHCWPLPLIQYGNLNEIVDLRDVSVLYSDGTWDAVKSKLSLNASKMIKVTEATLVHWNVLLERITGEAIYAVGGGLAVDAAKYLGAKLGRPIVCIPTVISVDAFLTWASGYRENGCVHYMETKPPDTVFVDFEVIRNAPLTMRSAGITDVLSIATGRHDWKFEHEAQRNPEGMKFDPAVDNMIAGVLNAAMACASEAGECTNAGLRRLFECLAMEVQLCNLIGHARPEEGSEHYFAYAAEEVLGKGLPHGELVGPGIMVVARLQGQDTKLLERAMRTCHVPLNKIPADTIRSILRSLPQFCVKHNLPYGIAHELTGKMIESVDLDFSE